MSKQSTISSLVRQAAKSEAEFHSVVLTVFAEGDMERAAEFFDRLNVPRSVAGDNFQAPLMDLGAAASPIGNYEEEYAIGKGIQKYMDRHLKKLKWHAQRPSSEGGRNVLLVMREGMAVTDLRLRRLIALLGTKDELSPAEWAMARELMNRAYLSFRHALVQMGQWIDACTASLDPDELTELVSNFYELIDLTVRRLEEHRNLIEERRLELTVLPEGYDPVKPPIYFGGDLMGRGPWKQFWSVIEDRSHHFREALA
jgi:hypothetical protein